MKGYDTSDLHRRQQTGDVGHAVLASPAKFSSRKRWRPLLMPLAVLGIGIVLGLWGPLPGLGLLLTFGGVMGLAMTAFLLFTDGLS